MQANVIFAFRIVRRLLSAWNAFAVRVIDEISDMLVVDRKSRMRASGARSFGEVWSDTGSLLSIFCFSSEEMSVWNTSQITLLTFLIFRILTDSLYRRVLSLTFRKQSVRQAPYGPSQMCTQTR